MKISAFDAALNVTWAMEERALETLLDIAAREVDVISGSARGVPGADARRTPIAREGTRVAVLDAIGPLFKRANLMTAISGATSYEIIRGDLQAALDDPQGSRDPSQYRLAWRRSERSRRTCPGRFRCPREEADRRVRRRRRRVGRVLDCVGRR
jgi:hypothetical protein